MITTDQHLSIAESRAQDDLPSFKSTVVDHICVDVLQSILYLFNKASFHLELFDDYTHH